MPQHTLGQLKRAAMLAFAASLWASCKPSTPSPLPASAQTESDKQLPPGLTAIGDWVAITVHIPANDHVFIACRVEADGLVGVPAAGSRKLKLVGLAEEQAVRAIENVYRDMYVDGYTAEVQRITGAQAAKMNAGEIERLAVQITETKGPDFGPNDIPSQSPDRLADVMRQEVEPSAIALLHHASPDVRWLAASRLGDLKSIPAVPLLIAALNDPEPSPRMGAANALGAIRDERGTAALIDMVATSRGGNTRIAAIEALGNIATPQALAAIAAVAPGDSVYWKAEKTLSELRQTRPDLSIPH